MPARNCWAEGRWLADHRAKVERLLHRVDVDNEPRTAVFFSFQKLVDLFGNLVFDQSEVRLAARDFDQNVHQILISDFADRRLCRSQYSYPTQLTS